jgi:hypothetical protein
MGLNVMHEEMGEDGIVSWLFAVQSSKVPWGPSPQDYTFDYMFHLVRHPLMAIPSIATFKKESWRYIADYIPLLPSDSTIQ